MKKRLQNISKKICAMSLIFTMAFSNNTYMLAAEEASVSEFETEITTEASPAPNNETITPPAQNNTKSAQENNENSQKTQLTIAQDNEINPEEIQTEAPAVINYLTWGNDDFYFTIENKNGAAFDEDCSLNVMTFDDISQDMSESDFNQVKDNFKYKALDNFIEYNNISIESLEKDDLSSLLEDEILLIPAVFNAQEEIRNEFTAKIHIYNKNLIDRVKNDKYVPYIFFFDENMESVCANQNIEEVKINDEEETLDISFWYKNAAYIYIAFTNIDNASDSDISISQPGAEDKENIEITSEDDIVITNTDDSYINDYLDELEQDGNKLKNETQETEEINITDDSNKNTETEGITEGETENSTENETESENQTEEITLTEEDLLMLPDDMVGATTTYSELETEVEMDMDGETLSALQLEAEGRDWTFDDYYVEGQSNIGTHLEKTNDFSAKYQMEIHFSRDVEINNCEIRVPQYIIENRNGEPYPPIIPVPKGTESNYKESLETPFNYYIDGDEIVFWNYKRIVSGTNCTIQILYDKINSLYVVDNTSWEITPSVTVSYPEKTETTEGRTLTGFVDTSVKLNTLAKTTHRQTGKKYTPGLYTEQQILSICPDAEIPENFDDYVYAAWTIYAYGGGNQPYEVYLKEILPDENCILLGFNQEFEYIEESDNPEYGGCYKIAEAVARDIICSNIVAVVAYPKSEVTSNVTVLENNVDVTVHPVDNIDEDIVKTAHAEWVYQDYKWIYEGDTIGIVKYNTDNSYPRSKDNVYDGWMDLYRAKSEKGDDVAGPNFYVNGIMRSFNLTHYTTKEEVDDYTTYNIGEYRPGAYITQTTVDDMVIAYPQDGDHAGEAYLLTKDDYYFNSATIEVVEQGYDVYEDKYSNEDVSTHNINRTCYFYAMFYDSDDWELIQTQPFSKYGYYKYTLTEEQIARQPYKLKAEFNTTEYLCNQYFNVGISIKADSPAFAEIKEADAVRLENIAGIYGWYVTDAEPDGRWIQDQTIHDSNYSEPYVYDKTMEWYDMLLMRDAAFGTFQSVQKHAFASKYANMKNDLTNGRVKLTYTLREYEGYKVYSDEIVQELKAYDVPTPHRSSVEYYDLLPPNVKFDPSVPVICGRLSSPSVYEVYTPVSTWNRDNIRVEVNPNTDIIDNWNNTGRMLVIFHIYYDGEDASAFSNGYKLWYSGFAVQFGAYAQWQNLKSMSGDPNIAAFMPASEDTKPIIGDEEEVSMDDGNPVVQSGAADDYTIFGSDINGDGVTNIRNVLYAKALAVGDVAIATTSGIIKRVRADKDKFAEYSTTAAVSYNEGYTYQVSLQNPSQFDLGNIIVFDRIENAALDRREEEPDMNFENDGWHGYFNGLTLSYIEKYDINPVVYYNTARDAAIPVYKENPASVITAENGWVLASEYDGDISEVKAVAIDMSSKTDGTPFYLRPEEKLIFNIKMRAPDEEQDYIWAYNNPAFFSVTMGLTEEESVAETVVGNSVEVKLVEEKNLVVEKSFEGEVPDDVANTEFEFTLKRGNTKLAHQIYELYEKDKETGEYVQVREEAMYATDVEGHLYLTANQKAVFYDISGAEDITIEEETNPMWEVFVEDTQTTTERIVSFANKYHPILYIKKTTRGVPEGINTSYYRFNLQITENGIPAANKEIYTVNKIPNSQIVPEIIETRHTDDNGIISVAADEVLCMPLEDIGHDWKVIEMNNSYGGNTNWLCEYPEKEGIASTAVNSAIIENIFRYKNLHIKKFIENQDVNACTQEFSFKIWQVNEGESIDTERDISEYATLITNKSWYYTDDAMHYYQIAEDGVLSAACAGKEMVIVGLEPGYTYVIQEFDSGEDYYPEQELYDSYIALYSSDIYENIKNIYKYGTLTISKQLFSNNTSDLTSKTFGIKTETYNIETHEWEPLANKSGTVTYNNQTSTYTKTTDAEGVVYLKSGEQILFEKVGLLGQQYRISELPDNTYTSIYPMEGEYDEGILLTGGNTCNVKNGSKDALYLQKKYVAGDNSTKTATLINAINNINFNTPIMMQSTYARYSSAVSISYIDEDLTDFNVFAYLEVKNGDGEWERVHPESDDYTVSVILANGRKIDLTQIDMTEWYTSSYYQTNYTTAKYPVYTDSGIFVIPVGGTICVEKTNGSLEGYDYRLVEVGIRIRTRLEQVSENEPEIKYQSLSSSLYIYSTGSYYIYINGDNDVVKDSGNTSDKNVAVLENVIVGYDNNFKPITKTVIGDNNVYMPLDNQAMLTLRVEKFDGRNWIPAKDISYYTNADANEYGSVSNVNDIKKTTETGYIHLFAPYLTVYLPPEVGAYTKTDTASIGTLRVVEVPELTDDSLGHYAYNTNNSIVNSVATQQLRVEKETDIKSDDLFTFQLGFNNTKNIASPESNVTQGIPYIVYDKATDTVVETGKTDENGQFSIKGGQYAILTVFHGEWTVEELDAYPWVLDSVEGTEGTQTEGNEGKIEMYPDYLLGDGSNVADKVASAYGTYSSSLNVYSLYIGSKEEYANRVSGVEGVNIDYFDKGNIKAYYVRKSNGKNELYYLSENSDKVVANPSSAGYMGYPFSNTLEYINVKGLDVSGTQSVSHFCANCSKLLAAEGFETWDWSNIQNANYLFSYCSSIPYVAITNAYAPKCTTLSYSFRGTQKMSYLNFSNNYFPNADGGTFGMNMGTNASSLSINVSNTTMGTIAYLGYSSYSGDKTRWQKIGNANFTNFTLTGNGYDSYDILHNVNILGTLEGINTVKINNKNRSLHGFLCNVSGLQYINISGLDMSDIVSMYDCLSFFTDATYINASNIRLDNLTQSLYGLAQGSPNAQTVIFDGLYAPKVSNLSSICYGCTSIKTFSMKNANLQNACEGYICSWDSCRNTIETADLSGTIIGKVNGLFNACKASTINVTNLTYKKGATNTDASYMFEYTTAEEIIGLNTMDLHEIEGISYMFASSKIKNIDISNMNFSGVVQSLRGMFYGCSNLETVTMENVNLSNLPGLADLGLNYCPNIQTVNISGIDLSSLETITDAPFSSGNYEIELLDASNATISCYLNLFAQTRVDTLNVTNLHRDLEKASNQSASGMFYFTAIKHLVGLNTVDMEDINVMSTWIYLPNTYEEDTIDISGMNFKKVVTANACINGYKVLELLDMSGIEWDSIGTFSGAFGITAKVIDVTDMTFNENAYVSGFFTKATTETIYGNLDWYDMVANKDETAAGNSSVFSMTGSPALSGAIPYDSSKKSILYANPDTGYFTRKTS